MAAREAGAKVSRPGDGLAFRFHEHRRRIIYTGWVAVLASGPTCTTPTTPTPWSWCWSRPPRSTWSSATLGWAGAAAERGIDVVAVVDINDPAPPMAKAEGRAGIILGMDDNVRPTLGL